MTWDLFSSVGLTTVLKISSICTLILNPEMMCSSTLSPPSNGNVTCTSSSNVGSICSYSCSSGYRLTTGSSTRVCSQTGNLEMWTGSEPTCESKHVGLMC